MQAEKRRIYVIAGPTASGKSSLGLALASEYPFEIISMDSMQIYRRMDVGTAKPTAEELMLVRHHMIDAVEPDGTFSCADYIKMADECIDDIYSRGKLPLFVGGTGLYLDGLIRHNSYEEYERPSRSLEYRRELQRVAEEQGSDRLYEMLCELDPESAATIHKNNVKRVMRALEIIKETGKTKAEADRESRRIEGKYDVCTVILDYPDREILYDRINRRVDVMMSQGLLDEARSLYDDGLLTNGSTASAAIGYKEFITYFEGNASLESCIELLKQSSRRYAKRQVTWFSRYNDAARLDMCANLQKEFKYFVNFCADAFFNRL